MNIRTLLLLLLAAPVLAGYAMAQHQDHQHDRSHAGKDVREISSLSAEDVEALKAGSGWGLALPAELNGYPGPSHLLEMHEELELDDEQMVAVQAAFDRMKARALKLGNELLAAEAGVDRLFRDGKADATSLRVALKRAADAKMALREVHLTAHLEVTPLLTEHQRHTYDMLRGYSRKAHAGHGSQ